MTYRKLFLWLFISSTLALAFGWWWSLQRWHDFGGGVPHIALTGYLKSGTLGICVITDGLPKTSFYSISYPTTRLSQATRDEMGWSGIFRAMKAPWGDHNYQWAAPLWFLWLVFNGSVFTLLRLLELRSRNCTENAAAHGSPGH